MQDVADMAAPAAPTCFPTSQKVTVSQAPSAQAPAKEDDVVAMILGSENGSRSAMSWASEEHPCL